MFQKIILTPTGRTTLNIQLNLLGVSDAACQVGTGLDA